MGNISYFRVSSNTTKEEIDNYLKLDGDPFKLLDNIEKQIDEKEYHLSLFNEPEEEEIGIKIINDLEALDPMKEYVDQYIQHRFDREEFL